MNLYVFFKISWKSDIKPFVLTYGSDEIITKNIRAYKNLQNQNDKKEIKWNHTEQCMKYFSWMLVWKIPHRVVISVRHWYEYCIYWFRFLAMTNNNDWTVCVQNGTRNSGIQSKSFLKQGICLRYELVICSTIL